MFSPRKLYPALIAAGLCGLTLQAHAEPEKRYIVEFEQGKKAAIAELIQQKRGRIAKALDRLDALAVELSASDASELAKDPQVASVQEDVKRYPMMMDFGTEQTPYGISMIQADQLSDAAAGNLTVCIIDTGYDLGHPDLPSVSVDGVVDPTAGNWFEDEVGHGTHVAGTIAALNNGEGVVGTLPGGQVNLFIVKAFNPQGWAYSSTLVDALEKCQDAGAKVVNLSLGGPEASDLEKRAFAKAYRNGVLSIAAAGNEGQTHYNYPASYDSVISVGAVDPGTFVAPFSQQNDQLELAAPGINILSTVLREQGRQAALLVNDVPYPTAPLDGSAATYGLPVTAEVVNCGIGDAPCEDALGKICLIERGYLSLLDKVMHCQIGGGIGAMIYNNVPGMVLGWVPPGISSIPAVGLLRSDGQALAAQQGVVASVEVEATDYALRHGTSMAAPHVSGAAALLWSQPGNQRCSAWEIREALNQTAVDLGAPGRDHAYGFGLLQVADAANYLDENRCWGKHPLLNEEQKAQLKETLRERLKELFKRWQ